MSSHSVWQIGALLVLSDGSALGEWQRASLRSCVSALACGVLAARITAAPIGMSATASSFQAFGLNLCVPSVSVRALPSGIY